MTIHVNGMSNSLAHKGSMGIAKSTLPDVCKTPSPGGPVPIPYPIIISMTSDLTGGTTTIKVDGGNMAAVKGSELSRCSGDEPGTAGGVKSSTNMKEAAWLLYSFDVKLDGKNACRLSDKLQMNHGNSACLAGLNQTEVKGEYELELDCNPDRNWNCCQQAQMIRKAEELDKLAKDNDYIQLRPYNPQQSAIITTNRLNARDFQKAFAEFANTGQTNTQFPPGMDPKPPTHYDDCAKTNGKPLHADHVRELQIKGGHPAGQFIMLDGSVNSSCGSQIRAVREAHPSGTQKIVSVTHNKDNCTPTPPCED